MDVPSPGDPFPGWEFAVPLVRPRKHSLFSLSENPLVVIDEPEQTAGAADRLWKRLEEKPDRPLPFPPYANFFAWPELHDALEGNAELALRELELLTSQSPTANSSEAPAETPSRPSLAFHGNIQAALGEARNLVERGYRVVFFARSSGELERLADIFQEYAVPFQLGLDPADATRPYLAERSYVAGASASTFLVKGLVRRGVVFPDAQIAVFGSEDLFDSSDLVAKPGPSKSQLAAFTADMADLKPGDYVVHEAHGIGRFLGTREIAQGDNKGDFMLLEYAGEAKLYVPLARLDLIQKYRGAGEGAAPCARPAGRRRPGRKPNRASKPKCAIWPTSCSSSTRSAGWPRAFASRPTATGSANSRTPSSSPKPKTSSPPSSKSKKTWRAAIPWIACCAATWAMAKPRSPCAPHSKRSATASRSAILAPTTVLAFQHFETFKRRFAAFPVRIEMLSRFRDKKEIADVLEGLAAGKVDIVVGTHRLLSKDVVFRDLGLLVVDEEQRFGVRHKERIKQLKHNVDVLTMSATPIPRTLAYVARGAARYVGHRNAAQGSPVDPHRRRALQ